MHLANDLPISIPNHHQSLLRPVPLGLHPHTVATPVVHITADPELQATIRAGLLSHGVEVIQGSTTSNATSRFDPHQPGCVLIDVDTQTADLCTLLAPLTGNNNPPVILVGRCEDARLPVRAIKLGAFDFFPKPIDGNELVSAILSATDQDRKHAIRRHEERVLRDRIASLTRREREVLPLVVGGLLNKQAAALLGISEITLQIHRGQIMRKMHADSLADLVRMCVKLRVRHWRPAA